MKSAWDILMAQGDRYLATIGAIQTEQPTSEQDARTVSTGFSRGGFHHRPRVGLSRTERKASLFITAMDTKVRDSDRDSYGFTNVKVANYEIGNGFVRNNALFSAMLSREQYDAAVVLGFAAPGEDIRKKVTLDFRRGRLFPPVPDTAVVYDMLFSQHVREVTLTALKTLRDWATKYANKDKVKEVKTPSPETISDLAKPGPELVHITAYYTEYKVEFPNDSVETVIDNSKYRRDIRAERKAINDRITEIKTRAKASLNPAAYKPEIETLTAKVDALKAEFGSNAVYHATPEQLDLIQEEYKSALKAYDDNAQAVRLVELALLETYGAGRLEEDGKVMYLRVGTATERLSGTPQAIENWKEWNGHRLADVETPATV